MASECYTRKIYDVFKKEWEASFDCGHETVSKDPCLIKCRVGYLQSNKEYWKNVEYRKNPDFVASCSCAKFETYGILCKHILYIMRKKSLTSIPSHYILPRWTMKATYKVGSIGSGWRADTTTEVNFLTLSSVRAKFNKLLEDGQESQNEIEKVDAFLDVLLEEQSKRKKIRVELNGAISSTIPSMTQGDVLPHIRVSDPLIPVKTKGRPKGATRMKSSIEMAMDSKKKRACGYCKKRGHNITGCEQRKMDEAKNMDGIKQ